MNECRQYFIKISKKYSINSPYGTQNHRAIRDKIFVSVKKVSGSEQMDTDLHLNKLTGDHEAQLLNYLKATGHKIGLLINFGPDKVEVKRRIL